ncbi:MAG: cell division protein ZipA C-terminal FtsZ-binding domain-containing protein [Myxococcaceae bacterium]
MRNATFAIVALLLAIGAAAAYWSMHSAPPPPAVTAKAEPPDAGEALKVVVAPASESAKRAALVLPNGPSEDAQAVLGAPPVPAPPDAGSEEQDYLPERQVEWVAELDLEPGGSVTTAQLQRVFSPDWMAANGNPIIHGLAAANHRWTYVGAADSEAAFTQLQLAWRLIDFDGGKAFDARRAKALQQALELQRKKVSTVAVRFSLEPTAAAKRAEQLEALRKDLQEAEIDLLLLAPEAQPFDARIAWDVLSCLGLEWGDGDSFHWNNPNSAAGDESLFSVSTSTPPGYLLPEVVAKGELKLEDLGFGFYVPRTHDPLAVLEAMLRGAKYAQKRLGGTLATPDGQPLDEEKLRARVKEAAGKLQDFGFEPGSKPVLQLL